MTDESNQEDYSISSAGRPAVSGVGAGLFGGCCCEQDCVAVLPQNDKPAFVWYNRDCPLGKQADMGTMTVAEAWIS